MPADDALLHALKALLGPAHVLHDGDLSAYELDWRRRYRGRARAVVRPGSTAEVAAVLQCCAAHGAAVVPQGGNTGLVGGGVPDASGTQVVLSLTRMNRIRRVDPVNLTLTAEAGCVLQAVQQAAAHEGLLFPLSLAAEGSCTLGGNLATNAGGTQVLRYGNARELCLGLEVVTPQGEIWDGLAGLRKDNTGYSLRDLYVGSEGTLGVITAATMRLYPAPAGVATALLTTQGLDDALALLQRARRRLDAQLTGFEAMNQRSLQLVARHLPQLRQPLAPAPWTLLVEAAGAGGDADLGEALQSLLAQALEDGLAQDAVLAQSLAQRQGFWHLRESISLAQSQEGLNIKHDIALPISRLGAFVREADALLTAAAPGLRLVTFGHLGDGNLHYNVQAPEDGDAAAFLAQHEARLNALVYDAVAAHGGTFSAEHGIGALKREELAQRKSPVALGLMRRIKHALDPDDRLNPGRML